MQIRVSISEPGSHAKEIIYPYIIKIIDFLFEKKRSIIVD